MAPPEEGEEIHWFVDLAIAKGLLLVSVYIKKHTSPLFFLG